MPHIDLAEKLVNTAALHAKIGMWRRTFDLRAIGLRNALRREFLIADIVDDGIDITAFEKSLIGEKMDNRLPKIFVLESFPQRSMGNFPGTFRIAAISYVLNLAKTLNNGVIIALFLHEQMRHALCDPHLHTGCADILPHANVNEPRLFLSRLWCIALQKCRIKKCGHIVLCQKMTRKAIELVRWFIAIWSPILNGPNPICVIASELLKSGNIGIGNRMTKTLAGACGPHQIAVFFNVENKAPQCVLRVGITVEIIVNRANAKEQIGDSLILKLAFEDPGDKFGAVGIVPRANIGIAQLDLALQKINLHLTLSSGFIQTRIQPIVVTPELISEYPVEAERLEMRFGIGFIEKNI